MCVVIRISITSVIFCAIYLTIKDIIIVDVFSNHYNYFINPRKYNICGSYTGILCIVYFNIELYIVYFSIIRIL